MGTVWSSLVQNIQTYWWRRMPWLGMNIREMLEKVYTAYELIVVCTPSFFFCDLAFSPFCEGEYMTESNVDAR